MADDTAITIPPERTEVLDAPRAGAVQVTACRHPFSFVRTDDVVPAGLSIAEIIERIGIPAWCRPLVSLDGWLVPEELWPRVRPRKGTHVTIRMVPMGGAMGGGGNSGQTKSIASLVLGIILVVVGIILTPTYGIGVPLIMMGAGLMLSGAAGLIFPPSVPKLGSLAGLGGPRNQAESGALSITGARNQANPYGPIPVIYGRHRIFPPELSRIP